MSETTRSKVSFGDLRRVTPLARRFGFDRGQPVDRFYIEQFLQRHQHRIRGHVLEVGDDTYTRRFGRDKVTRSDVLHVWSGQPGVTIVGDLAKLEGLPRDEYDCIICTQTLQLIFELDAAVRGIFRMLRPGGVVLVSVPGISQIDDPAWASAWSWAFTVSSVQRLFGNVFGRAAIDVAGHGNVLATVAFLHGLATEDLTADELAVTDPAYPLVVTATAAKLEAHSPVRSVVSIVITCFNQGHFLDDAIRSALNQLGSNLEVIVIDDGSTDDTRKVAAEYPEVRYLYQQNRGLSAARNTGFRISQGEFVVFLDADDRLRPNAVRIGREYLISRPECAFTSGEHCYIDAEGRVTDAWERPLVRADHYVELLRRNYIGMHATVMYRRTALQEAGGFDESLRACEDYDLYLRIARHRPVATHGTLIAEYRRYGTAMSDDPRRMLAGALRVMRRQRRVVVGDPMREAALAEGVRYWRSYYGERFEPKSTNPPTP